MFPILVLTIVILVILLRERLQLLLPFLKPFISPHLLMASGAFAVILAGFPLENAVQSINLPIMIFLYSAFVLATLLTESGYLHHLGHKALKRFPDGFPSVIAFIFIAGAGSAFLLNDTIAIIGIPLAVAMAKNSHISATPLIVGLAVAVTIGSVASPIGNPQNLIIAIQPQILEPFTAFGKYLLLPTVFSLIALAGLLWKVFPELKNLKTFPEDIKNNERLNEYGAARTGFMVFAILSAMRVIGAVTNAIDSFELFYMPVAGATVAILLSRKLDAALKTDYKTLIFFVGMFILMSAVWDTNFFQTLLPARDVLMQPLWIIGISLALSQMLSNVPLVILYLKALGTSANTNSLMLLASGSTLAGGLTFLGAASNIIVMQTAEKYGEKLPLREFTIIGVISVVISLIILAGWFGLIGLVGL